MSCEITTAVQCLDSSGALVLDLETGGYEVVSLRIGDRTWRRVTVTSPWVDGDSEVQSTLASRQIDLVVRVRGTTWVQVEQRRAALESAVADAPSWQFKESIEGVQRVWRAFRADMASEAAAVEVVNLARLVSVTIPVQPTPTTTGL